MAKTNWNMVIFEFLLFRTYCHNSSHHISCHLHRQETSEDQTSQGVSDANLLSNGVRKHQTLYIQHIHIPLANILLSRLWKHGEVGGDQRNGGEAVKAVSLTPWVLQSSLKPFNKIQLQFNQALKHLAFQEETYRNLCQQLISFNTSTLL